MLLPLVLLQENAFQRYKVRIEMVILLIRKIMQQRVCSAQSGTSRQQAFASAFTTLMDGVERAVTMKNKDKCVEKAII